MFRGGGGRANREMLVYSSEERHGKIDNGTG